jgi:hypothetical protein
MKRFYIIILVNFLIVENFAQDFGNPIIFQDSITFLYGYKDHKNNIEISPIYQGVNDFIDSYAIVSNYEKYGIINLNGDIILPIEYHDVILLKNGTALIMKSYYWEYFDLKTNQNRNLEYNYIGDFSEKSEWIAPFKRDSTTGILDTNLNEIEIHDCIEISNFKNGIAIYETIYHKGIIDKYGNMKTKPIYDYLKLIDNGKSFFIRDKKFGIIDKNGVEILIYNTNIEYLEVQSTYVDSLFYYFYLSNDSTFISNGELVYVEKIFDFIYRDYKTKFLKSDEWIYNVTKDYIFVGNGSNSSVFDHSGKQIIPFENRTLFPLYWVSYDLDGFKTIPTLNPIYGKQVVVMYENKKEGLFEGNMILLDSKYDRIKFLSSNLYIVKNNQEMGFYYKIKNLTTPLNYEIDLSFSGYVFKVKDISNSNKIGYFNIIGDIVIPFQYDDGHEFYEGLAAVKQNGLWGYINDKNQTIISFQYDTVSSFATSRAFVRKNGLWGIINEKGENITPIEYDNIEQFNPGLFMVYKSNYLWFVNYEGIKISEKILHKNSFGNSAIYNGYWIYMESKIKIFKHGKLYDIQYF